MNDLVTRSEAKISARDFTSFSLEKDLSMSVTQKILAASTLRHDLSLIHIYAMGRLHLAAHRP